MEQESHDIHLLSVQTSELQTCVGVFKQNLENITSSISEPIKNKLRSKTEQYMHLKLRPPRCGTCKTLLFLSECTSHRKC